MESKIDIKKLQNKIYKISNSKCPLDCFFNDIQQNNDTRYNKRLAYKDLEIIADFIIELQNKDKTHTEEEIKKEWEDEGFEIISFTKEKIEIYKQWIERKNNCSHHTSAKIVIEKDFFYIVGQFSNKYIQLLTKTFKMLEWEE